jgi:hypothetical protein
VLDHLAALEATGDVLDLSTLGDRRHVEVDLARHAAEDRCGVHLAAGRLRSA